MDTSLLLHFAGRAAAFCFQPHPSNEGTEGPQSACARRGCLPVCIGGRGCSCAVLSSLKQVFSPTECGAPPWPPPLITLGRSGLGRNSPRPRKPRGMRQAVGSPLLK